MLGNGEFWNWIPSNPGPASGTRSHQSAIDAGYHQHYFYGATNTLTLNSADSLIAYVFLDPNNLPSEIMLQWNETATGWNHRAYWAAISLISALMAPITGVIRALCLPQAVGQTGSSCDRSGPRRQEYQRHGLY